MPGVYSRILKDVEWLAGNASPTRTVKVLKELIVKESDKDLLPLLVIVPDLQATADEAMESVVQIEYTLLIALVNRGNQDLTIDAAALIDDRDAIRKALHVTSLTTATEVFDSKIDLRPVYDASGISKMFDYSLMRLTYTASESRN